LKIDQVGGKWPVIAMIIIEPAPRPGENVIAEIDGQKIGPIYFVELNGEIATVQGAETHFVPISKLSKPV